MLTYKSEIPFCAEVPYLEYQKHRDERIEGWGAEHDVDFLLVHHREPHEFVHYSVTSLFDCGIKLANMNEANSFGQVIHCFSTECPDQSFSSDMSNRIPHYFISCDWWECVDGKASPTCVRYCIINRDIDPDELYKEPMLKPLSPVKYCVGHFAQTALELETKYPKAYQRNNLVSLVYSIWNREDTVK